MALAVEDQLTQLPLPRGHVTWNGNGKLLKGMNGM